MATRYRHGAPRRRPQRKWSMFAGVAVCLFMVFITGIAGGAWFTPAQHALSVLQNSSCFLHHALNVFISRWTDVAVGFACRVGTLAVNGLSWLWGCVYSCVKPCTIWLPAQLAGSLLGYLVIFAFRSRGTDDALIVFGLYAASGCVIAAAFVFGGDYGFLHFLKYVCGLLVLLFGCTLGPVWSVMIRPYCVHTNDPYDGMFAFLTIWAVATITYFVSQCATPSLMVLFLALFCLADEYIKTKAVRLYRSTPRAGMFHAVRNCCVCMNDNRDELCGLARAMWAVITRGIDLAQASAMGQTCPYCGRNVCQACSTTWTKSRPAQRTWACCGKGRAPVHMCADEHKLVNDFLNQHAALRCAEPIAGTKRCPGCGICIFRTEGCPHMNCTQCGTHFCYLCGDRFLYGQHRCDSSELVC